MVSNASLIVASLLFSMALIQVALARHAARLLDRGTKKRSTNEPHQQIEPFHPHVAVLLPVRGFDPSLVESVSRLLDQSYDRYEIQAVVDCRSDPAWRPLQDLVENHANGSRLKIHEMVPQAPSQHDRGLRCGLKCHALIQAVDHAGTNADVIVLVDADVTPHRDWLEQAVTPLSDPKIGAVTGNQWFEPHHTNAGSVLRSMWNAGAIVPTLMFKNPWAGTCAMRVSDVRESGLMEAWSRSIIDDGPISDSLDKLGLDVHFEPALMMVNRDQCSAGYVSGYITRMLTWSRMYESTFVNTVIHAGVTFGLLLAIFAIVIWSLVAGNLEALVISFTGLLLYSVGTAVGYVVVRGGVNRAVSRAVAVNDSTEVHSSLPAVSVQRFAQLVLLAPVIQAMYAVSCFRAIFVRRIRWRQIDYEISGRDVRLVAYRPFVSTGESLESI